MKNLTCALFFVTAVSALGQVGVGGGVSQYPSGGSGSGGTGNAANEVAVAFSATPTFTCGSATAGTATHFIVGTLTGSIASSTLASCTPGQIIDVTWAMGGSGSYTVAMPTGFDAPAIDPVVGDITTCEWVYNASASHFTAAGCASTGTSFLFGPAPCRAAPTSVSYPSGKWAFWCDSTSKAPTFATDAGGTLYIAPLIKAARTANQFVTNIDSTGTQNTAAIAAADIPVINVPTPGATCTFAANSTICIATTTATITVPVPVKGYQFCVVNGTNVSTVITLSAIGSSATYENTARTAAGTAGTGTLVSSGAVGDGICIFGQDSTHYLTLSYSGAWTAN